MPRMESAVRKNPSRRQPGYAQCRAPQPACTNHSRHSQVPSCCCQSHLPHFQLLQIRLYFLLPVMTSSFSVGHYRSVIVAVRHGRHLSAGFGAGAPRPLSAASRTPAISAYSALREAPQMDGEMAAFSRGRHSTGFSANAPCVLKKERDLELLDDLPACLGRLLQPNLERVVHKPCIPLHLLVHGFSSGPPQCSSLATQRPSVTGSRPQAPGRNAGAPIEPKR
jgi:hypothetical protein